MAKSRFVSRERGDGFPSLCEKFHNVGRKAISWYKQRRSTPGCWRGGPGGFTTSELTVAIIGVAIQMAGAGQQKQQRRGGCGAGHNNRPSPHKPAYSSPLTATVTNEQRARKRAKALTIRGSTRKERPIIKVRVVVSDSVSPPPKTEWERAFQDAAPLRVLRLGAPEGIKDQGSRAGTVIVATALTTRHPTAMSSGALSTSLTRTPYCLTGALSSPQLH